MLAERLLLGPELFESRNRVASRLVGLDQVVYQRFRFPAGALGRSHPVRILAEHLDINHRASLTSCSVSARAAPLAPTEARREASDPGDFDRDPRKPAPVFWCCCDDESLWSAAPRPDHRC